MKNLILGVMCLFIGLNVNAQSMPDKLAKQLEKCGCKVKYFGPVCSRKGKWYLNDCIAKCLGAKMAKDQDNCTVDSLPDDKMTWPIHKVCNNLATSTTPKPVEMLEDGSLLYERQKSVNFNATGTGTFFRGGHNTCRCLVGDAVISTKKGDVPVSQLKKGDIVFSLNKEGALIEVPIILVSKTKVGANHQFLHISMEDGRELKVSPLHPDSKYQPLQNLKKGDVLDGKKIYSIKLVPANVTYTYDILPKGPTGIYWANGIPIGSTLK